MVLSGRTIKRLGIITPCVERAIHQETNTSYGLSPAGYDIRLDQDVTVIPGLTTLASTIECFTMPKNIIGVVHDKSTWARRGLAVQNTVIEPGWRGFLTLELSYAPSVDADQARIILRRGTPIAQVIYHYTDEETEGYGDGKYQDQQRGPQGAR